MTGLRVTTLRERPDLLPVVALWVWREWWAQRGRTLEETEAVYVERVAAVGVPQAFVLLEDGRPVGTASLTRTDLAERPNLTPWLAGVFVVPERRGLGHVRPLLSAFEAACREASIGTAWLYTNTAERVYARAGWEAVEVVERPGRPATTLMRRVVPGVGAGG